MRVDANNMCLREGLAQSEQVESQYNGACPQSNNKKKKTTPTLVFMAGFAGAGKTTLANYLESQLGWAVLNKDLLKLKNLAARANREEDDWEAFVEKAGWDAFIELFDLTEKNFAGGEVSLIVDTCGYPSFILEHIVHICQTARVPAQLKVLLCLATKETRKERLLQRGSSFAPYICELPAIHDDEEAEGYFKHLDRYNPQKLRTDGPFEIYADQALSYVKAESLA
jgi:predicted kinase